MSKIAGAVGSMLGGPVGGLVGTVAGGLLSAKGARSQAGAIQAGSEAQILANREAIQAQREAAERAQQYFAPFRPVVQQGLQGANILADPQAQFQFLQNNPLFQFALDQSQRQLSQGAAASGRLGTGDYRTDLAKNVLLQSQPLIDRQRQDVLNLLNLGTGLAQTQGNIEIGQGTNVGNLLQNIGDVQAAGRIGQANVQAGMLKDIAGLAGQALPYLRKM